MRRSLLAVTAAFAAAPVFAQAPVSLPQPSPKATVTQVVGVTSISVSWSRPAVKGRKVWGGLVPWGDVWRAGANENTVVTFSTPVQVEGQPLAAGSYGLHAIPGEVSWTVIFSRESRAWGSYSYDAKEDALRVAVKPRAGEHVERLSYGFDDVTDDSAFLTLRWEKLVLPIKLSVDRVATVTADLAEQLRGLPQFGSVGWTGAARWLVANGGDLALAEKWIDRSIALQKTGTNLLTKAEILEKKGDAAGAAELRAKSDEVATEAERNNLGYAYLQAGKMDLAIATFQKNTRAFPASWNAWDSLAEGLATKGDRKAAAESYSKALSLAKDDIQKQRIQKELAKLR